MPLPLRLDHFKMHHTPTLLGSSFCSRLRKRLSTRPPLYRCWVDYHCLTIAMMQQLLQPRMVQIEVQTMAHLLWTLEHRARAQLTCLACTSQGLYDRNGSLSIGLGLIIGRALLLVYLTGYFCSLRPGSYRRQSQDIMVVPILLTLDEAIVLR